MNTSESAAAHLRPYRARIDALDEKLVALLAERVGIIREVGAMKFRENIPAILQDRVDAVRENAAAKAEDHGIDPDFVRRVYTLIIDYSCALEDRIKDELAATRKAVGG